MAEYEASLEEKPELGTNGGNDKNKTCEECGQAFHAYEIPGREVYKCNGCK